MVYSICWNLFWIFTLPNKASTDFSWQKTETCIAHKQPIPAAWEQYLLYSIWAHPTAATAFSQLWQWETLKEAEFAKLCDDTWKSKIVKNRKMPARCLWLTASWDCPTMTYTRLLYYCTEQEFDSLWQSGYGVSFLSSDFPMLSWQGWPWQSRGEDGVKE